MGTMRKGPIGGISGKVAGLVYSSWKGKQVVRKLPTPRQGNSTAQLIQQAKFSRISKLLSDLIYVIDLGFKNYTRTRTAPNSALKYNMPNIFSGTFPDFIINYGALLVSRGNLHGPDNAAATAVLPGKLVFTWENTESGGASSYDKAIMVAYCPELNYTAFTLDGPYRKNETGVLNVSRLAGQVVHTYLFFMDGNRTRISNSKYTGALTIT